MMGSYKEALESPYLKPEEFKETITQRTARILAKLDTIKAEYSRMVQAQKGELESKVIEKRKRNLKLEKGNQKLQEALNKLHNETEVLISNKQKQLTQKTDIKNRLSKATLEMKTNEIAIKKKQIENSVAMLKLEKLLSFSRLLGLRLKMTADSNILECIFTQINPSDPDKEYLICVKVESGLYIVVHCVPQIPSQKKLLEKLNETNDFSQFIFAVRKIFQGMAVK